MKLNTTKLLKTFLATIALSLAPLTNAAQVVLSNHSYLISDSLFSHHPEASSETIDASQNFPAFSQPMGIGLDSYYGGTRATSYDLYVYATAYAGGGQLFNGDDYVGGRANASFQADLMISGANSPTAIDISFLNDAASYIFTENGGESYGERSIQIYKDSNLVFSYIFGVDNPNTLKNIILSSDETYRFEMNTIAYAKVYLSQRAATVSAFSATISVSTVPIPSAAVLFGSGFLGLIGAACKRR